MSGTLRQDDVAMKSSVKTVLAVDVGGSSVKILATGQSERRSFSSGPALTPRRMDLAPPSVAHPEPEKHRLGHGKRASNLCCVSPPRGPRAW
jgi:hypothetical protein